jgi:hypothetical protein
MWDSGGVCQCIPVCTLDGTELHVAVSANPGNLHQSLYVS